MRGSFYVYICSSLKHKQMKYDLVDFIGITALTIAAIITIIIYV